MAVLHTVLENRRLLRLGGTDAIEFLQNLLTQNVTDDPAPPLTATALLTPQGKLAYDMLLWRKSGDIWLDLDADQLAPLKKKLMLYKLRANVSFTAQDVRVALVWSDADDALPALDGFVADPRHKHLGLRGLFDIADSPPHDLPGMAATPQDWHMHRLSLGVPEGPHELPVGKFFPLELGFPEMAAIDFQKGCFVGQEVTSRTHRRGKLRKRLWPLTFETAAPPAGTAIVANDRTYGEVVTARGTQALALLRDDAPSTGLHADGLSFIRHNGLFEKA